MLAATRTLYNNNNNTARRRTRGGAMTLLQDGVYELSDMLDVVQEPEVQRLLKAYDSITVDLHCTEEGQWAADRFNQLPAIKSAKVPYYLSIQSSIV